MQSDWLRTFWPIFQEHLCPDLCRNTANNINFHYRTNSVKINDQMFQKTLFLARFCPILPILGAKNFFAENSAVSRTIWYRFLSAYWNLEKTNDTIPRKGLNRQNYRWKDGQTLFYRAPLAPAGDSKCTKIFVLKLSAKCNHSPSQYSFYGIKF